MYQTIYEPANNIIVDQPIAYKGKSAVMQDTLLKLLKDAKSVYILSRGNPESEFIFLHFKDAQVSAKLWIDFQFTALPFWAGAKVEREFTCGVRFQDLIELLSVQNTYIEINKNGKKTNKKYEPHRIDFTYDPVSQVLRVDGGNWRSNLKCIETQFEGEPVVMERSFTKEEQTELTWLKKSAAKENNRPALMYAHVVDIGGIRRAYTADGYRAHLSIAAQGFEPGVIDIQKIGAYDGPSFQPFEYFTKHTEDKVWMNRADFESAVKKAKASVEKNANGAYPIELHFHTTYCAIIGRCETKGIGSSIIATSGMNGMRSLVINAQYVLDALQGSKADKIQISFANDGCGSVQFAVSDTRLAVIMAMLPK